MTPTELKLTAIHRGPVVPLETICNDYLHIGYDTALQYASLNQLPFATFRLRDSKKAPLMVSVEALAAHIDSVTARATKEWNDSQV